MTASPVTGRCRRCGCLLSGERVYCGPDAVQRDREARQNRDRRKAAKRLRRLNEERFDDAVAQAASRTA